MKYLITLLLLLCCFSLGAETKPAVTVYSYHLKPPLVIDLRQKKGLYFDFVEYLNSKTSKYQFQLMSVPRKRIDFMLENKNLDGPLLGVNPTWFKDKSETRFLWTGPVFTDRDEMVSLRSLAVQYIDAESIKDRVLGGVRGFYYYGLNEAVAAKELLRVDTAKEVDLFQMLILNRVDVAVISRSTFDYMVKINQWQNKFHLSKTPHDIFDRRIMVPKNQQAIYLELSRIVDELQFDKSWKYKLLEYK